MDKIIVLVIFSSPVVMYLYSANARINLTCPECSEVGISMEVNQYEKEFVILVVLRHVTSR
jgi:hypothetical protein